MAVILERSVDDAPLDIEIALTELEANKKTWTTLSLSKKISLLDEVRKRLIHWMITWGRLGAEVKACADDDSMASQEMLAAVGMPATYISKLLQTLRMLAAQGKAPQLPVRTTGSGQLAVQVYPLPGDRVNMLLPGAVAELILKPEVQDVRQAELYGADGSVKEGREALCAVLGAGNHGFLAIKDVLVCLYERGHVVALKPHPQWFKWQQIGDYVLQPLIKAGFVRTLYLKDMAATQALLYHPKVNCVHMTGGTATHDAIVWGITTEEQQRRRQANDPLLKVPITSELGCVTPFIIAGGEFTAAQLRLQAENLVVAMTSNMGCNCNSAKVLLLPGDWPQADVFMENVRAVLRGTPMDPPYYPGIQNRYEAFKAKYPDCEMIEGPVRRATREGLGPHLPYLINFINELPADPKTEYAFNVEPFAPVLSVVRLPTRGPQDFLQTATAFANEQLWGTLSCVLVLHPELEEAYPEAAQKAIDGLRYGVVAVNSWAATSCILGSCTWGAFQGGQTIADVGSGLGLVGNSLLVEEVQKAVYRTPLEGRAVPRPYHVQPVPKPVVRMLLGFLVGGWGGLLRSFWAW